MRDGEPRYWNYLGFSAGNTLGGLHRVKDRPVIILVEGYFDLLRAYPFAAELGADVVCSWRAEITKVQAEILGGLDKSIQVWYDQDDAGHKGYEKVKSYLRDSYGLKRATWNRELDVGEMPKSYFNSIFESLRREL